MRHHPIQRSYPPSGRVTRSPRAEKRDHASWHHTSMCMSHVTDLRPMAMRGRRGARAQCASQNMASNTTTHALEMPWPAPTHTTAKSKRRSGGQEAFGRPRGVREAFTLRGNVPYPRPLPWLRPRPRPRPPLALPRAADAALPGPAAPPVLLVQHSRM